MMSGQTGHSNLLHNSVLFLILPFQRIVADVSDSQRSRPSIMAQHLCDIKWGFVIGSKCFVPKPKVGGHHTRLAINSHFKMTSLLVLPLLGGGCGAQVDSTGETTCGSGL